MLRIFVLAGSVLGVAATSTVAAPNLKNDPRSPDVADFKAAPVAFDRAPSAEYVIAPNGKQIVFFGYNRGYYVFDVAAGKVTGECTNNPFFHDITFSPDGKQM